MSAAESEERRPSRPGEETRAQPVCDLRSRVSFTDRVVIRDLGDEAVVLHLDQEKFFGLDEVGLRMVSLLREDGRVERAYRTLLEEYDVPADQLRQDLLGFVDLLARRDLLRLEDGRRPST